MLKRYLAPVFLIAASLFSPAANAQHHGQVEVWLTSADKTSLLQKEGSLAFHKASNSTLPVIDIDVSQHMQSMEGFGFALTGGSAELLMKMTPPARHAILKELFTTNGNGIGVSYLRISIGSSDMNERVFTYDDMPPGEKDPQLAKFDLGPDKSDVIPVLKQILAIRPKIKILGSPWTPPSWMKSNDNPKGGSLLPESYPVYAQYFVKYIQGMAAEGIPIDAVTVQNEPLNPKNTPSLVMESAQEADFIANDLGPAFAKAGIKSKIILYDHNVDRPDYPLDILAKPSAAKYVAGSGFHLYEGEIEAMSKVHDAHPDKDLFFTEQMIIQKDKELPFHIANSTSRVIIGATRNWARNVLLWNLAADPNNGPHTSNGGCPVCQGAITLDGDAVTRNLAFYTVAQIAKFAPPASVRIASTLPAPDTLPNVAFETPEHRIVLLVANPAIEEKTFDVRVKGSAFTAKLGPGDVATLYLALGPLAFQRRA